MAVRCISNLHQIDCWLILLSIAEYVISMPNMYARGILFGTMKYELGDHAYVRCPETGLSADIEFKTKGYFSGTYDAIGGYIKDQQGNSLYEFSGLWNDKMYIKDLTVSMVHIMRCFMQATNQCA